MAEKDADGCLEAEREAQKQYWKQHSEHATVEAMMLDSKAKDIDKLERPEVWWDCLDQKKRSGCGTLGKP